MALGHENLKQYEGVLFDELLYQEPEILAKIDEMADYFVEKYRGSEEKPLFVCLLLMIAISKKDPTFHPELDFMTISKYQDARDGSRKPIIKMDLAPSTMVKGRAVVILDEVLDTGDTIDFTKNHIANNEPSDISVVVLCQKEMQRTFPEADMYGFLVPEDWQTGIGMDDAEVAREGNRWMLAIALAKGALAKRVERTGKG
jgi:hypoxanthine phosphoribosyltransferase